MLTNHSLLTRRGALGAGLTLAVLATLALPGLARPRLANAADTGHLSGSTFTTVDASPSAPSETAWTNPGNAQSSNNSYATVTLQESDSGSANNRNSDFLTVTGFNFNVPANSTIDGIEVKVERSVSSGSDSNEVRTEVAQLVRGGTRTGSDLATNGTYNWTSTDTVETYGGATNTWGTSWTAAEINASNMGFAMQARHDDDENTATARVDHVTVRVFYTVPPTPAANPALGESCGLDVAFVVDSSGSMSNGSLESLEADLGTLVDALAPGTESEFAVVDFDSSASLIQNWTASVPATKAALDLPSSGGYTNWEAGLVSAGNLFPNRESKPDLIVFATDGDPNRRIGNSDDNFQQADLNEAIEAANAAKEAGARVVAIGIGSSFTPSYLESIASADAVYSPATFLDAVDGIAEDASALCGGTVTVSKVIDEDGNLETTEDQTSGGSGWEFTLAGEGSESLETTETGSTSPAEAPAGTYVISEEPRSGYELLGASCANSESDAGTWNGELGGIQDVEVANGDVITCTFYNHPLPGSLTVKKIVENEFGGNASPDEFTLSVVDAGSESTLASFPGDSEEGTTVSIPAGTSYTISEDGLGGYAMELGEGCTGTMAPGAAVTCRVTNTEITATTGSLTVIKTVTNDHGGTADPEDFSLFVTRLADEEETPPAPPEEFTETVEIVAEEEAQSITTGLPVSLDPGTYQVSELEAAGYVGTFSDGDCAADGTITIEAGSTYTCYLNNDDVPATITVSKEVVNDSGRTSTAPDFAFTLNGGEPIAFNGDGSNVVEVLPGTYTVAEYDSGRYAVSYGEGCSEVTVPFAGNVDCTVTNNDLAFACTDEQDNDEDGLVDAGDPGCHSDGDPNNEDSYDPTIDSEVNGFRPACSDGYDSDGDDLVDMADPNCDSPLDTNEDVKEPGGSGGGSGGSVLGESTTAEEQGQAAPGGTVLGASCAPLLTTFMGPGMQNNPDEVKKLQEFLNGELGRSIPVTGFYGPLTTEAVKAFQVKYKDEVLTPWASHGLTPDQLANGTGYVYKTTQRWINLLNCKDLDIPMPQLP